MEKDKRMYVAVLMGGVSSEREVSLHSGQGVADALRRIGFDVFEAAVDDASLACIEGLDLDAAFIALHGAFGEDGRVQALLEEAGIPYVGSGPEASRLALDKIATKRMFTQVGIPTPQYVSLDEEPDTGETFAIFAGLGPRVVIKPACQGSSIGVSIVDEQGFTEGVEKALKYDGRIVVERFIKGRELTVGILGDRALPIIELKPHREFFDYTAKYQYGETDYIINPELPKGVAVKAQQYALDAFHCLGCRDISRVDLMLSEKGELLVLEVNTIPGFTETSLVPKAAAAIGISFPSLCKKLVEFAVERAGAANSL